MSVPLPYEMSFRLLHLMGREWLAHAVEPDTPRIVLAASSLECLRVFALAVAVEVVLKVAGCSTLFVAGSNSFVVASNVCV